MYRFLAFFWFIIGILLLALPYIYPQLMEYEMMANHVPLAGFCFALAAYNTIRWRLIRARDRERERLHELELRRRDKHRVVDPTFDFSDHAKPDGADQK